MPNVSPLKTTNSGVHQAAKPGAAYDAEWGKGFMQPDAFVGLVYSTL